ncbi:D-2-hydroxyacid dehydrogenase [Saccharospirillum salsuginis]|uniref:Lactate dehydrogenase n=1 Tax=Saccharospirillum salsuginis TaxID=418750 RepID=A0A918ND76_9GAMM|nr:D-2-hydroxyacid dehydrogenase [Saccharospirillum salsuginis]GGX63978.1 lactate dehydrogenase [Saccharospirillum salsuginis]
MKGVFLDRGTFPDSLTIQPPAEITDWREYHQTAPDERLSRLQGCDLAVVNKVVLDGELIDQLPDLKCVAVVATGINNIDLEACHRRGITVVNATGYGTDAVAEHAVMLMLALNRNLKAYLRDEADQGWSRSPFFCHRVAPIGTLSGQTLAIVGKGDLGCATAERARALGMTVIFAERPGSDRVRPGYTAFEEALKTADVISLHCPLTDRTHRMINRTTLGWMKPTATLINTGRGDLVNETDLLEAIEQGRIGGAGLDVASQEPPPADHPIWRLARHERVILTPHVAWASHEAMTRLLNQINDKLTGWARGEAVDSL